MKKISSQSLKRIPKKLTGTAKQKKGKKIRFIFNRDMTEYQIIDGIEKLCKEHGIKFVRDVKQKAKVKAKKVKT